jgi:hypothetical protein
MRCSRQSAVDRLLKAAIAIRPWIYKRFSASRQSPTTGNPYAALAPLRLERFFKKVVFRTQIGML